MLAMTSQCMSLVGCGVAVVVYCENAERGCQKVCVRIGFAHDGAKLVNGQVFAAANIVECDPDGWFEV
jgi:hypothetical protein